MFIDKTNMTVKMPLSEYEGITSYVSRLERMLRDMAYINQQYTGDDGNLITEVILRPQGVSEIADYIGGECVEGSDVIYSIELSKWIVRDFACSNTVVEKFE